MAEFWDIDLDRAMQQALEKSNQHDAIIIQRSYRRAASHP